MLVCPPTPQEQVGAALLAAGYPMAAYQPPRLDNKDPSLGGCTPGWIARQISDGWVLVAYRPAGILTPEQSYAVQLTQLERYAATVFPAPAWTTMFNRRNWPGVAALLVRKIEAGHE
jgi:hypothetical protein